MSPATPPRAGIGPQRPREADLLATATRLFRARGFHATSMQDLAEALGMNRGSLYHYIASKDDLLWRVFCRAFDLDYGGLDIMRDKVDGRIYIVDVNYTPFGPPVELSVADRATALGRLAVLFQKTYIDGLPALMRENTSKAKQSA